METQSIVAAVSFKGPVLKGGQIWAPVFLCQCTKLPLRGLPARTIHGKDAAANMCLSKGTGGIQGEEAFLSAGDTVCLFLYSRPGGGNAAPVSPLHVLYDAKSESRVGAKFPGDDATRRGNPASRHVSPPLRGRTCDRLHVFLGTEGGLAEGKTNSLLQKEAQVSAR